MSKQSEQILEKKLIENLQKVGYAFVAIKDEEALLENLKKQLEKHNRKQLDKHGKAQFTEKEFSRIVNILNKGNVFEKAKTLREKQHIVSDEGEDIYFEFINTEHWCQNEYQVTHQVTVKGKYTNRYDVTLLINGLPLVQIELKRKGMEMKEAFNQINRYQKHSFQYNSALFQYVQIFVISNGVNTKYYANNRHQSFKQTFFWADENNKRQTNILNGFTDEFLEPCHVSKMICKYIVLNETDRILMVLRPYQYYAVEAIIKRVKETNKNGYIWHTTGSGKTLTSFKASQILTKLSEVYKVVFVVDRKDLDYQTTKEFNSFSAGSVDGTDNTRNLVKQFIGEYKDDKGELKNNDLIVTTIQKLNTAISKLRYEKKMAALRDQPIVFIFDECHRSQFGDTHQRIIKFFKNTQLFGFTGTPIFADNAHRGDKGKKTTKDLFDKCLHKYVITDAIKDENVLKFSVEYVGKYQQKDSSNEVDIEVEDIDTKELMENESRLEKIVDYIIQNHDRKTHTKDFSAIFCVSSVNTLMKYYDIFKRKKIAEEHDLNVATIFSYAPNEEDAEADGLIHDDFDDDFQMAAEPQVEYGTINASHSRDKLEEYIADYNQLFNTDFSTKSNEEYYGYYNDIAKKIKDRERKPENPKNRIDILLVVNMFLTGFDAKKVNTMYVDKNLRYHGLIQTYSRTNRILNETKSQGNIVVFRNLKKRTDEAIALFSNKEAKEDIIIQPYEDYVKKFNTAFVELLKIAPTVDSVNELQTEEEEMAFVQAFRKLIRLKNILTSFADFKWADLSMSEQKFEEYKSKYLDLYDKVKTDNQKEKVSILKDVDFELELIHRDVINVAYIIQLLIELKAEKKPSDADKKKKEIIDLLGSEPSLRSKRELIEKFIQENLPHINNTDNVVSEFEKYWSKEQQAKLDAIIKEENLSSKKTERLIETYLFDEKEPLTNDVLDLIEGDKPGLLQRKTVGERILNRIVNFVETFIENMNLE